MTKVVLVAGGQLEELPSDADVWVGVDRGSLHLIEKGLAPDLAVGDFDSVSQQEFELIQKQAKEILCAQPEKDDTDLELAVTASFERYPDASVTIFATFGGRMDHTLANVFLPRLLYRHAIGLFEGYLSPRNLHAIAREAKGCNQDIVKRD